MLAGGLTLDEIPYWREGTLDKYTPWGDYVVVKFSRWDFEKFPGAQDKLGTQMRAVGEVMSIGKNYKEAFQKAIRSLEKGRYGLGFVNDFNEKTLDDIVTPHPRIRCIRWTVCTDHHHRWRRNRSKHYNRCPHPVWNFL